MGRKSKIVFLGSGSSGNCTLVYDSRGHCLVLDCGLTIAEFFAGMEYDLENLDAVLVTHVHDDHSHLLKSSSKLGGLSFYGNEEVCERFPSVKPIGKLLKFDGWKVQTFEVPHGVQCNAFIIDTYDGIRIFYCTDCMSIPYKVRNVNHAIIEANYDPNIVLDLKLSGNEVHSGYVNHHSINDCEEYIRLIYWSGMQSVTLFHLSSGHSNEVDFIRRIKDSLGIDEVYAAKKGVEIELNKSDF